jgi:hypothetical protein
MKPTFQLHRFVARQIYYSAITVVLFLWKRKLITYLAYVQILPILNLSDITSQFRMDAMFVISDLKVIHSLKRTVAVGFGLDSYGSS